MMNVVDALPSGRTGINVVPARRKSSGIYRNPERKEEKKTERKRRKEERKEMQIGQIRSRDFSPR